MGTCNSVERKNTVTWYFLAKIRYDHRRYSHTTDAAAETPKFVCQWQFYVCFTCHPPRPAAPPLPQPSSLNNIFGTNLLVLGSFGRAVCNGCALASDARHRLRRALPFQSRPLLTLSTECVCGCRRHVLRWLTECRSMILFYIAISPIICHGCSYSVHSLGCSAAPARSLSKINYYIGGPRRIFVIFHKHANTHKGT